MNNTEVNIPVLTFHSVGNHMERRPWSFLTISVEAFENSLRYLKNRGYNSISLKQLYSFKLNNDPIPERPFVLNFDDGFLDNWTIVYPILEKYGFKGTVYVSPDFVDPRPLVREFTYNSATGKKKIPLENWWGYASWEELKMMDRSGLLDVQGHALTHTWYPCSSEIIDFHRPGDNHFWLWWNEHQERKPFWLTEYNELDVPYGLPVFRYSKSILKKRYLPSSEVNKFCTEYISLHGGASFFSGNRQQWMQNILDQIKREFGNKVGRFETDQEYEKRLKREIVDSKNIIETRLDKRVEFLAWPGGGYNETALEIAKSAGYLSFTVKGKSSNGIEDKPEEIYRMGGWSGFLIRGKARKPIEKLFLKVQLARGSGHKSLLTATVDAIRNIKRKRILKKTDMEKLR